jgi:hypothetical protein
VKRLVVLSTLAVLCLFTASDQASTATVRFGKYKNPDNETTRTFNTVHLDGVKEGLIAYNIFLEGTGAKGLFCLPPKVAITADQAADIMMRAGNAAKDASQIPISLLLMQGLIDTFPCP